MLNPNFKAFPSIGSLPNYLYTFKHNWDWKGKDEEGNIVRINSETYPVLEFTGKIKLHGTNACIAKVGDEIFYQKRSSTLDGLADNAGFKNKMLLNGDYTFLFDNYDFQKSCYIYGEWCGIGVQNNVACSQVEKFFCIFAVVCDGEYVDIKNVNYPDKHIYNVSMISHWKITIDLNNPELCEELINKYVDEVEIQDPFMKQIFNVSGIGEGIVWYLDHKPEFKTKGEKHKISGNKDEKIKVAIPMFDKTITFLKSVITEVRINQACTELNTNKTDCKSYGNIMKWIINDIIKEEMPTIIENQFSLDVIKTQSTKIIIKLLK